MGTVSSSHTIAVGAGVGVSVGISALILAAGLFCLRRRRRERKHKGTVGANTLVSRPLDGTDEKLDEKKEGHGKKSLDGSGGSVHSEPLPAYSADTGGNKGSQV